MVLRATIVMRVTQLASIIAGTFLAGIATGWMTWGH